jgi:uncharacterized membrane protein YhaH (DUF805 family)
VPLALGSPLIQDHCMTVLWTTIGILIVIIAVITIVDIVRRRQSAGKMVAWILLVVVLPFLGALLYWALRKPTAQEVENARITGGDVRPPFGRDIKP